MAQLAAWLLLIPGVYSSNPGISIVCYNNERRNYWKRGMEWPFYTHWLNKTFHYFQNLFTNKFSVHGQEPWSSGYGRRLVFQRLWVQILASNTGWTFFTFICCKNCNVVRKDENKLKRAGVGTFFLIFLFIFTIQFINSKDTK